MFDIGGVVVNYSPLDFLVDRFFHERTEKKLYDAVFGSAEWLMLDKGEISWEQACDIFMQRGRDKDISFEMQALVDGWTDMLTDRKATIELMRLLKKKGFHLYYLSNISKETLKTLSQRKYWQLFDGGVASSDIGALKPDPKMYQTLLDKYQLIPEETIFADDHKPNAAAAFEHGITGIHFKNLKSFCKILVDYGIDT